MKPTLLVLAAGMGSRYGGLKQLDPVGPNGETIIDYSVFDAIRAGFGRLVFVIRPDFAELFKKDLGSRFEKSLPVGYAFQEPGPGREKPWGTGQAVLCAADLVHEPFAMINADDFYGAPAFNAMAQYLSSGTDYAMVTYPLKATLSDHGTVSRGLCELDASGALLSVTECIKIKKEAPGAKDLDSGRAFTGEEPVSMNFFGFQPSLFAQLQTRFTAFAEANASNPKAEFYIPKVVDALIQEKQARVQVLQSNSTWFGVTYKEDKPLVAEGIRRLIAQGQYPASLK